MKCYPASSWFLLAALSELAVVDEDVGLCIQHNLHRTDHTKKVDSALLIYI